MSEIEGVAQSLISIMKQHCHPPPTTTTTRKVTITKPTRIVPTSVPLNSSPTASMGTTTGMISNTIIPQTNHPRHNILPNGRKVVRLGPRKVSNSSVGGGCTNTNTLRPTCLRKQVRFGPEVAVLGSDAVNLPTDPTDFDVVITRNYTNKVYLGNSRYRELIHAYQEVYAHCSDGDDNANVKVNIAGYVVDAIRKEGNGRFLKEDGNGSEVFRDIGYTRACQKTMQALRVAVDGMVKQKQQRQTILTHKRPIHENCSSQTQTTGSVSGVTVAGRKRMKFGAGFRKVSNPVCAPRVADEQEAEIQRILSSKHLMDEDTLHRKLCEVYSRKQQQSVQSSLPSVPIKEEAPSLSVFSKRM